jgi:hypothetical protein
LRQWCGLAPLLEQTINFYRIQLHRHKSFAQHFRALPADPS